MQKPFELFFIQHSHIDVGFTHRQEQIGRFRADFLRQVVRMLGSEKQQTRSASAKFKYVCEGFWEVEQFLKEASPEEKMRFLKGFSDGYLELSPSYLHLTELLDEEGFGYSLQPAIRFARQHRIDFSAAMSCDINGFSWGMSEIMYQFGIRYLSTSINSHHGGYPLGGPLKPFYWITPGGGRILSWIGLPYHKANLLGLIPSLSPDSDAGIPGVNTGGKDRYVNIKDISLAEQKILPMVDGLRNNRYPYNFMPIMGGGLYTDNNPPIDSVCELIETWNERFGDRVHIQTATLKDFFSHIVKNVSDIPEYAGDWTDWWADGVASTPAELSLFRNAQRTRQYIDLLDPDKKIITQPERNSINQSLLMYSEHTWGHTNSNNPWSLVVRQSLMRKGKFAVEADEKACDALDKLKAGLGEGSFTSHRPFTYRVINPFSTKKTDFACLPFDTWEIDLVKGGLQIKDLRGRVYPFQIVRKLREFFLMVELTLEAKESVELKVDFINQPMGRCPIDQLDDFFEKRYVSLIDIAEQGLKSAVSEIAENCWENDFLKIAWDFDRGVTSLFDKERRQELLSVEKAGLFSPVYQLFRDGKRSNAAGFNLSPRKIPADTVFYGKLVKVSRVGEGALCDALLFEYTVEGASHFTVELTVPRNRKALEVSANVTKENESDPEGLYIAFPFNTESKNWVLDRTGAPIIPGVDQLPGACADYYLVQSGAALVGENGGVALTCLDAPLVHIGGLNLWKFSVSRGKAIQGPLYSWLTNNKWEVNFCGHCGGFLQFRYKIDWGEKVNTSERAVSVCRENQHTFLAVRTDGIEAGKVK